MTLPNDCSNKRIALFSWALLAYDGKNRIICSRSSPSKPYQILLGTNSEKGLQWLMLDQPDLAPDGMVMLICNSLDY